MDKLTLQGREGAVELDRVILGTNTYGRAKTEQQAFPQLGLFVDELGGSTLDTATVYGETTPGVSLSELVIGKWLKGRARESVKIISKGCCYKLSDPKQPRLTPEALREDLFQSLDALGTDYIDVFLLHRDNPDVPVGEMVDALDEQVSKGLIRVAGVSNWWMERIQAANAYARANGRVHLAASEVQWSLAPQTVGRELLKEENNAWMTDRELAAYRESDVAVLAYFAQARGYIAKRLGGLDLGGAADFDNETARARALRVGQLAEQTGHTPSQISLAYLLHSGLRTSVLVGASSEEQLRDSAGCVQVPLTPEQVDFLRGDEQVG